MREVAAYFLVYQVQDVFPGVGEEAAGQRDWDPLVILRRDGGKD